ncbi:MAG: glycosyltransferase family 9 protein [bacterium]
MKRKYSHELKVMINPRLGRGEKFWPAHRIAVLIQQTWQRHASEIWIVAGSSDQDYVKQILDLTGHINLKVIELLQLEELVAVLKTCSLFIGVDTGTTRLAISLGVPAVVLFGPTQPSEWYLTMNGVEVLNKRLSCSPCSPQRRLSCRTRQCLADISPEDVLHGISNLKEILRGGTRIRTGE